MGITALASTIPQCLIDENFINATLANQAHTTIGQ
jgi:hypothetical protein